MSVSTGTCTKKRKPLQGEEGREPSVNLHRSPGWTGTSEPDVTRGGLAEHAQGTRDKGPHGGGMAAGKSRSAAPRCVGGWGRRASSCMCSACGSSPGGQRWGVRRCGQRWGVRRCTDRGGASAGARSERNGCRRSGRCFGRGFTPIWTRRARSVVLSRVEESIASSPAWLP